MTSKGFAILSEKILGEGRRRPLDLSTSYQLMFECWDQLELHASHCIKQSLPPHLREQLAASDILILAAEAIPTIISKLPPPYTLEKFLPGMHGAIRNKVRDCYRYHGRRQGSPLDEQGPLDIHVGPVAEAVVRETAAILRGLLRTILEGLDEKRRKAFFLKFRDDWSLSMIGHAFGVAPGNVSRWMSEITLELAMKAGKCGLERSILDYAAWIEVIRDVLKSEQ